MAQANTHHKRQQQKNCRDCPLTSRREYGTRATYIPVPTINTIRTNDRTTPHTRLKHRKNTHRGSLELLINLFLVVDRPPACDGDGTALALKPKRDKGVFHRLARPTHSKGPGPTERETPKEGKSGVKSNVNSRQRQVKQMMKTNVEE